MASTPNSRSRLPNDQLRPHHMPNTLALPTLAGRIQRAESKPRNIRTRYPNSRQRRRHEAAQRYVVETNHRHFLRNAHARGEKGAHYADGHEIVGSHNSRGTFTQSQQLQHRPITSVETVLPRPGQLAAATR